jgi:Predicted transcriptional regulator
MPIKYDMLFTLMKERGLTTYRIRKESIISQSALTSLKNGKSVTMDTIAALCKALDCQPGDILEYIPDETSGEDAGR